MLLLVKTKSTDLRQTKKTKKNIIYTMAYLEFELSPIDGKLELLSQEDAIPPYFIHKDFKFIFNDLEESVSSLKF